MKRIILASIAFLFLVNLQAKKVDIQTAQNVGIAYYYEHVNQFVPCDFKGITILSTYTETQGALPLYYVFNINKNGFIIVSADDNITPVIGYSYESNFDINNIPDNLKYWLGEVKNCITYAIQNNVTADANISSSWSYYKSRTESNLNILKATAVAPLTTSTWDQGKYYNQYCPAATGGPDGKAYVGCVATSMAQVMYYYRYPAQGNGSHGGVNFGTTTYDWNSMLDGLANYNPAAATLLHHCGVAVNMSYSATGSGAQTSDCPNALKNYFKYNSTIAYTDYSPGYNQTTWQALLKNNIDASHPLIYSGYDLSNGGHAWVCDGYDASNNFHMNWGWSGSANGYFATTSLSAGGYDFSSGQGVVYNFFPPTTSYPSNCTGTQTLTSSSGTFEDGSGSSNYQNNDDCLWLISPTETVTKITLSFITFNTEATNDVVTVYDGNSTSAAVLGTYSGSSIPASITSTGPQMLVRFQTNGSVVSSGWKATYRSTFPQFCSGITTLSAPSGSFNDGSLTDSYSYNQLCRWFITPTNATSITLSFSAFNLATNDSLRVYDYATSPMTKLAAYSGTTIPASHTYNTGNLYLLFATDAYLNSEGFDASYTSTQSSAGIDENSNLVGLNVFPNPAKEQVNIQFTENNIENLSIELTTLSGVCVYKESLNSFSGVYNNTIKTSSFAQGIYLLRIVGDNQAVCKKIVIE